MFPAYFVNHLFPWGIRFQAAQSSQAGIFYSGSLDSGCSMLVTGASMLVTGCAITYHWNKKKVSGVPLEADSDFSN